MNKLEEYKENWANDKWNKSDNCPDFHMSQKDMNEVLQEGFDAAIALDLPVKFAEWQKHPEGKGLQEMLLHFGYYPNMKEKYQYWRDNILKIE